MRNSSQRGFTLLEVLVATIILAVAVSALLANLSTSTSNLFITNDIDRLTFLSKRKMDELITLPMAAVAPEGVLAQDGKSKPTAGYSVMILPATPIGNNTGERVDRVVLRTWLQVGTKRRTMVLESFRTVKLR